MQGEASSSGASGGVTEGRDQGASGGVSEGRGQDARTKAELAYEKVQEKRVSCHGD